MAALTAAFLGAGVLAAVLTVGMRALARRLGLLAIPEQRSAHVQPVPLGGGVAIVVVVTGVLIAGVSGLDARAGPWSTLALGGIVVAAIGLVDDRRPVAPRVRIAVHAAAIAGVLAASGELGPLQVPGLPAPGLVPVLAVFGGLLWLLNLYNFMDGIDGFAALEAVIVSLGLVAALAVGPGGAPMLLLAILAVAGASLGFLFWNWPPAGIFLGDAGSGYLGFMLGALALFAHRETGLSLWVPTILLAVFVADATLTLLRRMFRGDRWYEPHRLHAYQWSSRRFGSHRPVTLALLAVGLLWLVPLALIAARWPEQGGLVALFAYVPVVAATWFAGAGRVETNLP